MDSYSGWMDINLHPWASISTHRVKNGWSKDVCKNIAMSLKIPKDLMSADHQRSLIIQFLQLYTTGNIEGCYDVTDVVLAVASMIPEKNNRTASGFAWPDEYYSDIEPFAFSVISDLNSNPTPILTPVLPQVNWELIGLLQTLGVNLGYGTTATTAATRPKQRNDPIALNTFYKRCNEILSKSPATGAPTLEALALYRLCNFVALTMLRATIQSDAQMVTGFLTKQYKSNVSTVAGPTLGALFTPPCKECIEKVCCYINKARQPISSTMAKIVCLSTTIDDPDIKAYLDTALLTHTSWNGIGMINMLFKICEFFSKTWIEIYKLTHLNTTADSWKVIIKFLEDYESKTPPDMTVPWARVIDDAYFSGLGPQNHPQLAALLKRSVEYAQGKEGGLSNAVWARKHYTTVDRYKEGSECLLNKLKQTNIVVKAGSKDRYDNI